jgi:uncharacterized protein (TIGR00730 family)
MRSVCVFCGSSTGNDKRFTASAQHLARAIASAGLTLVYGGGKVGLMGIVADETLLNSGKVIGVIPQFLYSREVGHDGVTQLEIVQSMHERKKRMAELSDAFIAMPGGWGTLEELAEILTWKQLGLITQPVGLLNAAGFFDPLLKQFNTMHEGGFLAGNNLSKLIVDEDASSLLARLQAISQVD